MSSTSVSLRFHPLLAGLCGALSMVAPATEAGAITRNVLSCADDGSPLTLRSVVAASSPSDTVNLGTVPVSCSVITLQSGEIAIPQEILTISGPADRTVAISGNGSSRIFNATYAYAVLTVNNLTLVDGLVYSLSGDAAGGCVRSGLALELNSSVVSGCAAGTGAGSSAAGARGGAIYARGDAILWSSVVQNSSTYAFNGASSTGGGVWANDVVLTRSSISGNSAGELGAAVSKGGGFFAQRTAHIMYSTVDGNRARYGGGGYVFGSYVPFGPANASSVVTDSTISGNIASSKFGGLAVYNAAAVTVPPGLVVSCSTVAFNSAPTFPGVWVQGQVAVISSILARNSTAVGDLADLYISGHYALSGRNSLVVSSNQSPAGVIVSTADPQLAPLAYHGGPTRTHALLATSPAIDQGDPDSLPNDQRGAGFPRSVGSNADIGAYERQIGDDEIFYSGFN